MGQLQFALIRADLAGEKAANPGLQRLRSPGLVEKRERKHAVAIGDAHLENAALAPRHATFAHIDNLGNDRNRLANWQVGDGGQLAARRIATRVVREQVGHSLEPQMARERLGGSVTQNAV